MPSGTFSLMDGVPSSEAYSYSHSKTPDAFIASNTNQGTFRGGGVENWSGNTSGKGHTPPFMPNDELPFIGYSRPDSGVEGGTGQTAEGDIIVASVSIQFGFTGNQFYSWEMNWMGQPGLAHRSDGAAVFDTTLPQSNTTCGNQITYGGGIVIPAITSATLTITAALDVENNSTSGANGVCGPRYSKGPIDFTLSMVQEDWKRGVAGYPELGDDLDFTLNVGGGESWRLKYAKNVGYVNTRFVRNGSVPISRTLNFSMSSSSGSTPGQILRPGDTAANPWWGTPS